MAQAKRKSRSSAQARSGNGRATAAKRKAGVDAIALLKSDHREVESMFAQFEKSRSDDRKKALADKICNALKAHATIEEEIFYPAFLEATEDKDLHHEAEVEHAGAKHLIAEIEAIGPDDDYYDAKVKVLSEMIKHHVKEEEQRGGMFAEAKQSDMDLGALGAQMKRRKAELLLELEGDRDNSKRGRVAPALLAGNRKSPNVAARRG